MVLPSRLSRRFAIGISVIGGGMPRGFRATIFGAPTMGALPAAVFPLALVCAAAAAPASQAGDAPSSESKLRRLMLISTPVDCSARNNILQRQSATKWIGAAASPSPHCQDRTTSTYL